MTTTDDADDADAAGRLLTPGEVGIILRVDAKTVSRWAADGRLRSIRTPGGQRRFYEADITAIVAGAAGPT